MPDAVGIDSADCVKWRETLPSQEESAGRDVPMGQLVTKVLVSRESPLPPCQIWSGHNSSDVYIAPIQFNSHLFLSLIGARTLKMPVPYPPPSVGAYTQTPSHPRRPLPLALITPTA